MKLSRGEFCSFKLESRVQLLQQHGTFMIRKQIDETHAIRLFYIYDFYVEVFCDTERDIILRIEPIIAYQWLDVYVS